MSSVSGLLVPNKFKLFGEAYQLEALRTRELRVGDVVEAPVGSTLVGDGETFAPLEVGADDQILVADSTLPQGMRWANTTPGSGDVDGPILNTATDNAICRWDGVTGRVIQNSTAILDDAGRLTTEEININTIASKDPDLSTTTLFQPIFASYAGAGKQKWQTFVVTEAMSLTEIRYSTFFGTVGPPVTVNLYAGRVTSNADPAGYMTLLNTKAITSATVVSNTVSIDYSSDGIILSPGDYTWGVPGGQIGYINWGIIEIPSVTYPAVADTIFPFSRTYGLTVLGSPIIEINAPISVNGQLNLSSLNPSESVYTSASGSLISVSSEVAWQIGADVASPVQIGANSNASGANSVAVGDGPVTGAQADSTGAVAVGAYAQAITGGKVGIGYGRATASGAVAVGGINQVVASEASGANSLALGVSVASNDRATCIGYLGNASGLDSIGIGSNCVARGDNGIAMGNAATTGVSTTSATAIGTSSVANGDNSLALGRSSTASGNNSLAAGVNSEATQTSSVAVGDNTLAQNSWALSLGASAQAVATNAVAVGGGSTIFSSARAAGANATALGTNTLASGNGSVSLGVGSIASHTNSLAIGVGSTTAVAGQFSYNAAATQSTVGAAGAASALPATPSLYWRVRIGEQNYVIPLYLES